MRNENDPKGRQELIQRIVDAFANIPNGGLLFIDFITQWLSKLAQLSAHTSKRANQESSTAFQTESDVNRDARAREILRSVMQWLGISNDRSAPRTLWLESDLPDTGVFQFDGYVAFKHQTRNVGGSQLLRACEFGEQFRYLEDARQFIDVLRRLHSTKIDTLASQLIQILSNPDSKVPKVEGSKEEEPKDSDALHLLIVADDLVFAKLLIVEAMRKVQEHLETQTQQLGSSLDLAGGGGLYVDLDPIPGNDFAGLEREIRSKSQWKSESNPHDYYGQDAGPLLILVTSILDRPRFSPEHVTNVLSSAVRAAGELTKVAVDANTAPGQNISFLHKPVVLSLVSSEHMTAKGDESGIARLSESLAANPITIPAFDLETLTAELLSDGLISCSVASALFDLSGGNRRDFLTMAARLEDSEQGESITPLIGKMHSKEGDYNFGQDGTSLPNPTLYIELLWQVLRTDGAIARYYDNQIAKIAPANQLQTIRKLLAIQRIVGNETRYLDDQQCRTLYVALSSRESEEDIAKVRIALVQMLRDFSATLGSSALKVEALNEQQCINVSIVSTTVRRLLQVMVDNQWIFADDVARLNRDSFSLFCPWCGQPKNSFTHLCTTCGGPPDLAQYKSN